MPIVLITLGVGIAVGYWLCRMQLRGKFLLAEEGQPFWGEVAPTTQIQTPPTIIVECNHTPIKPHRRVLRKFPDAQTEYFSAKQVIGGYDDRGFRIGAPEYPGGIKAWNRDHGWVKEDDE